MIKVKNKITCLFLYSILFTLVVSKTVFVFGTEYEKRAELPITYELPMPDISLINFKTSEK